MTYLKINLFMRKPKDRLPWVGCDKCSLNSMPTLFFSTIVCLLFFSLSVLALPLPPTDHEYTWLERQRVNFLNQQLIVDIEEKVGTQKWDEAEKLFREALANDPNNNELRSRFMIMLSESGQYDQALRLAYEQKKKYPKYPRLLHFIGVLEEKKGNHEAAHAVWRELVSIPGTPDDILLYAAKSLYPQATLEKNRELALQLAEIWALQEPSYDSYLQYASSLWKAGRRTEAINILKEAVEKGSPSQREESSFHLAYILIHVGREEEALPYLRYIATQSPDSSARYQAAMQKAHLHYNLRQMGLARDWLDQASQAGPKDEAWRELYGQTILEEGNLDKTLAAVGEIFDADQASFLMLLSFQFLQRGFDGLAYYFIQKAEEKESLPARLEPEYWSNRAYMAERQNEYEDVLLSMDQALLYDPSRFDWKIVRLRALFLLGDSDVALREARQLEQELLEQPASPENQKLLNETIDFIASGHLAREEYRDTIRTARQSHSVYTGSGLYRYLGLAYYHMEEYDESEEAFQEFFRRNPDPDPDVWIEYGFLQEKRKEWEVAIEIFTAAVQKHPFDLQSQKALAFVYTKAIENDEALESAKAAIDLESETVPSAFNPDRRRIRQNLLDMKTLVGNLQKTWTFQAFANYNEFLGGSNQTFISPDVGLPAELGGQISYRPPVIGFRDYRTFDIFLRAIGQFDKNSLRPLKDRWQGGIGGEWKPFKTWNYVTSLEYLFKIGSQSRYGWLWRNRGSFNVGDYPREEETYWLTLVLFGDIAWYWDRDFNEDELALFTEDRLGISWRIRDNVSITFPQIQGTIRYVPRGYTEESSYLFGGIGANLRIAEREKQYTTNTWYTDLYLHYDWGRFLDEDARITGSRFRGWAAGIRFYR